jgi:hypothetical protein
MGVVVSFNCIEEWLSELVSDREGIVDNIVRVTIRRRLGLAFPTVDYYLMGTALIHGRIVLVERHCGAGTTVGGDLDTHGKAAAKRADDVLDALLRRLTEMGLEVRSGIYTFAGAPG